MTCHVRIYLPCEQLRCNWRDGRARNLPAQAIELFEQLAARDPTAPKWPLTIASCLRRGGDLPRALARYEQILAAHPEVNKAR